MRRSVLVLICPFVFLALQENVWAQQIVVPAGTLLRCTLNEPNFSSATAEVGDPVVCHVGATQQFGREAFPRDTYIAGHLEAYKDPGHLVGKGWLQLSLGLTLIVLKSEAIDAARASRDASQAGIDRLKQPGFVNKAVGALETAEGGIPVLGPGLVHAGRTTESGDTAGGLGETAGLAAQIVGPAKAEGI